MGEIAAIFHWQLPVLEALPIDRLLHWHGVAVDCWNRMNPEPKK